MRTSWEKLIQYMGTNYSQDISNELQNKTVIVITEPYHSTTVLRRHGIRETMIRNGQANLQTVWRTQKLILEAEVATAVADTPMKLAILENEITQGDFEGGKDVPIVLMDTEKMQHSN